MIPERRFPADPWQVSENDLDLEALAQSESIFALSNGHIGVRGNLDEGDPHGIPGTYLNSFYEVRPLPYAEAGYGFPETGQTVLNVTNGKLIRLLVDDEPLDLRYGCVHEHRRVLDLRAGVLRRSLLWETPAGERVRVRSTRLVSLTQRSILAIRYSVQAVDVPVRVVAQSELVANEEMPSQSNDPRVAAVLEHPLYPVEQFGRGTQAMLMHRTDRSGLRVAAAMDHVVGADTIREMTVHEDWARLTIGAMLEPGERLDLVKIVGYGWSGRRTVPALRDQVEAAVVAAVRTGWEQLVADQKAALDVFWQGADVEIEGDDSLQQAVRFGLFHTFQAGARAERRAIPAKGLTGPGYDGHAFWDTEMFVLPVLTATAPHAAADALMWRHSTLDLARERAATLNLRGACFPWRTIRGQECSGYWPAGTAAMHVNADIAEACERYLRWTHDRDFDRDIALPILLETARLWISLGYVGQDGCWHLDGVTGPDEYSAICDDNVYTNLMAARNLAAAARSARRWPVEAEVLGVTEAEIAAWEGAADRVAVPYDRDRRVHEQARGYTARERWSFEDGQRYPLMLHAPYFDIYRKQVIKQADLLLAMHWCGDAFSDEDKARAFAYYEPLTVRDSSLSACTQAVLAAEVGQLDLALDYTAEAALMDLHDLEHNARDGLHIASLAGTWLAIVAGFGGMRDHGDRLSFRPQLAPGWRRFRFRVRWRGARIEVELAGETVTYTAFETDGEPVGIDHCGRPVRLTEAEPQVRSLQYAKPLTDRPAQPPGRAPNRARSG
ncbi:MAG: glycoside hydrolase family 65 protein [Jatrophihabitans sp.]|nr:MAG: glycoside hydrolase family 65 protein [Jatrophihabitans sp.]